MLRPGSSLRRSESREQSVRDWCIHNSPRESYSVAVNPALRAVSHWLKVVMSLYSTRGRDPTDSTDTDRHVLAHTRVGVVMVLSGAKKIGKPRAPSSGLCREPLLRT